MTILTDHRMRSALQEHRREFIDHLAEWVRIPSIAGDPDHVDDLPRSANALAGLCRAVGFPRAEVWQQGETSTVFAEWPADATAPTVLVYSHHDVRAVIGESWNETQPFTPIERDGCLFGRGASDAKAQVIAHLWGLRALLGDGRSAPPVTVKLLVDGEEETGSPNLAELMEARADDLTCDLIVYSDTTLLDPERPALTTSVRGMIGAELTVLGPAHDVHSGAVSGPAPNPVVDLARLISRLHDEDGRITLPGFYDAVTTPTAEQSQQYSALEVDDAWWLAESDTMRVTGEHGYSIPELLWARPALEVISIKGGDLDDLPRAVIPASATASLSIRLVDGQSPEAVAGQLERWVEAEADARGIRTELSIARKTAEAPYRTPAHPAVEALDEAMRIGFGVDFVGRMGNAGGGPAELLARTLDAPLVFFGTGLVSDRWHDSDERVRLDVLEKGAATLAAFWPRLAEAMRDEQQPTGSTTHREEEMPVSDAEITPSEPDPTPDGRANTHGDRPSAGDLPLPEEIPAGDEMVEADTASGGAPEPAGSGGDD
ncbi:M20/M25/M40 family metallo-hydrolase [Agromyces ramosus]|uniref:Acetylornithine deacetylase/succinyl-diaminopimelate desuccinylase-like protein n=1 Tax=Agromyces ramosus TaxID=33879 RepID=A0ABU0RBZ3_9MICO|nr:M20/M25/M40 family metallo-hydrolase [Agromyces ramosus]MDQ0895589.1 acetylornithine deacetylase/succinyl-diaminopimelate desuccinylase-like protein [Agromyces ramosus]